MAAKVLLLREPDGNNDKYHNYFLAASRELNVASIPVLEFEFCNQHQFLDYIENSRKYGGIIFTSPRAAAAFFNCFTGDNTALKTVHLPIIKDNWTVFVVGKGSSRLLRELGLTCHGENCGNAEELAKYISSFHAARLDAADDKEVGKPYIFPCGNIARETIPVCLTKDNIPFHQFCVYNTKPNTNFKSGLDHYMEANGLPNALVFFSPSGVNFFLDLLKQALGDLVDVKIIAIGKTTAKALDEAECRCDGVSPKPTPECLLETVLSVI